MLARGERSTFKPYQNLTCGFVRDSPRHPVNFSLLSEPADHKNATRLRR